MCSTSGAFPHFNRLGYSTRPWIYISKQQSDNTYNLCLFDLHKYIYQLIKISFLCNGFVSKQQPQLNWWNLPPSTICCLTTASITYDCDSTVNEEFDNVNYFSFSLWSFYILLISLKIITAEMIYSVELKNYFCGWRLTYIIWNMMIPFWHICGHSFPYSKGNTYANFKMPGLKISGLYHHKHMIYV